MRNLTLGVLIVTGGTLAALPFRRGPSLHDASSNTNVNHSHATGPLESALDTTPMPSLVSSSGQSAASRLADFAGAMPDDLAMESPHPVKIERSRTHVKPLTLEDLMAPIKRPEPIQNRYQALAGIHQPVDDQAMPTMDLPPTEELAPALRSQFQQRFATMEPSIEDTGSMFESRNPEPGKIQPRRAGGTLASSMVRRSQETPELSQAPKSIEPALRQRQWITQPN